MKFRYIALVITFLAISATLLSLRTSNSAAAPAGRVAAAARSTPEPAAKPIEQSTRKLALTDAEYDGHEILRSDEEWQKELSPEEYIVMRKQGTEEPYTGALLSNHKRGVYYCAACGLAIFSSDAKFESGTGWPSFFKVLYKKNVIEKEDRSLPEVRTEVECARCHAHLGHVFDDGPKPTGLRYCMNSVALKFKAK